MTSPFDGYEVDPRLWPSASDFDFDLEAALDAVVALEATVPHDAYTASTLGVERIGNGVVIGTSGLVLTIGYLLIEAEAITLTTNDGRRIPAHALGTDTVTGLGLVQALEPLDLPHLPLGNSRPLKVGGRVLLAGAGGRAHALAGRVLTRGPFAGYWEYLLDDAIVTEPAHPHWSGAALIGPAGGLVGIGSLAMQAQMVDGAITTNNLFVPAELLPPILGDLAAGRAPHPPRPWLGVISRETGRRVEVVSTSPGGPAARAELRAGDSILAVAGVAVSSLAEFYQALWACGPPGVRIGLQVRREDDVFEVEVRTADRMALMKRRRLN